MTILTVPAGWLLALKLNYCISGNKYEGNGDGETDSKKYQSMESGRKLTGGLAGWLVQHCIFFVLSDSVLIP
jgi:hypothetical protein